jgi:hypothetical protein
MPQVEEIDFDDLPPELQGLATGEWPPPGAEIPGDEHDAAEGGEPQAEGELGSGRQRRESRAETAGLGQRVRVLQGDRVVHRCVLLVVPLRAGRTDPSSLREEAPR